MSFSAQLNIDGQEFNVLEVGFGVKQPIDKTGKPSGKPHSGGLINLVVESTGETDLYEWASSETQTKSGAITFLRVDGQSRMRKLEFTDAFCVSYYETFHATNTVTMQISLSLSAREITMERANFANSWPMTG